MDKLLGPVRRSIGRTIYSRIRWTRLPRPLASYEPVFKMANSIVPFETSPSEFDIFARTGEQSFYKNFIWEYNDKGL